jgi:hypothetical protein
MTKRMIRAMYACILWMIISGLAVVERRRKCEAYCADQYGGCFFHPQPSSCALRGTH